MSTTQTDREVARLRKAIKKSGMTQRAVAKRIGVEDSQLSRWLGGTVRPIRLYRERIAKELNVKREAIWDD